MNHKYSYLLMLSLAFTPFLAKADLPSPCRTAGKGVPCRTEITMGITAIFNSLKCEALETKLARSRILETMSNINILKMDEISISYESFLGRTGGDAPDTSSTDDLFSGNLDVFEIIMRLFQLNCPNTAQYAQLIKGKKTLKIKLKVTDVTSELNELANKITSLDTLSYNMSNNIALKEIKYQKILGLKYQNGLTVQEKFDQMKARYTEFRKRRQNSIRNIINAAGHQASLFSNENKRIKYLDKLTSESEGRMQVLQIGNHIAADTVEQFQKLRELKLEDVSFEANLLAIEEGKNQENIASMLEYNKDNPAIRQRTSPLFDPYQEVLDRN